MINIVFKDGKELKDKEGKYIIGTLDGKIHEADSFKEMVAVICGLEYQECECAETEFHMRYHAAKRIGLAAMVAEELELMESGDENDEDIKESIIIYDERIGKIPYSYTTPEVDYEIHGDPQLIRVECDETFIYSLEKARLIAVWEKIDGEYQRYIQIKDLEAELDKAIDPFRNLCRDRVPLHKKLGE